MDIPCPPDMQAKEDLNLISEEDYNKFSFCPTIEQYLNVHCRNNNTAVTKCALNDDKVDKNKSEPSVQGKQIVEKMKTLAFPDLGPAMEYPQVSRISSEDHKWLILEYEKLLLEQMDKIDPAKVRKMQELKTQVMEEQEQFQQFVFHHARFNFHLYNFINPEVLTSVKNILQCQRAVLSKSYPQYYTLKQTVGLAVGAAYPSDPVMKFEKMLLQRGEVPRLVIPDDERLSALSLTKTFSPTLSGGMCSEMQPLSKDQIAVTLAKTHGASIVISSEAFTTLVQSQQSGFQQQWDLPIIVQELKEGNDVKKILRKVVYLEDPLPKLSLTPKEVNDIYFKRSLTETCCKPHKQNNIRSASIPVSGIRQKGSEGGSSSKKPRKEESDNLPLGSDGVQTKHVKAKEIEESISNDKNKSQNPTLAARNKVATESTTQVKDNVVYNLWTFGKLRLLICCSLEGYKEISREPPVFEYYSILPKLEYQPTFGHERLTATESARMWAHAFIRPNTKILCGRINRYSSAIMRTDELEIGDVLNAGEGFNPAHAMKMVYKVLESVISLPEGDYLLSHSSGDIHSCLFKSTPADCHSTSQEKRAMLDLYSRYEGNEIKILSYKEKEIPFSRIDTNLFLPINIEQNRFAATFPAVPARELEKLKKDIRVFEGSKKGKKKKGKKKKKATAAAEKRVHIDSKLNLDHLAADRNEQNACADQGKGEKGDSSLPDQSLSRRAIKRAHRVIRKANLGDVDLPKEENMMPWEEMRHRDAVSYTDLDDF